MDISPRSSDGGDLALRLEGGGPVVVVTRPVGTRASQERGDGPPPKPPNGHGHTASHQVAPAPVRARKLAPLGQTRAKSAHAVAREALTDDADILLADARASCRRDDVPASQREVFARIAKRIGLSQAEVAEYLSTPASRGVVLPADLRSSTPDDPMAHLAATILGAREHAVFTSRRDAPADDIAGLHRLAAQLGVTVERIYQLEASARRKLSIALG